MPIPATTPARELSVAFFGVQAGCIYQDAGVYMHSEGGAHIGRSDLHPVSFMSDWAATTYLNYYAHGLAKILRNAILKIFPLKILSLIF